MFLGILLQDDLDASLYFLQQMVLFRILHNNTTKLDAIECIGTLITPLAKFSVNIFQLRQGYLRMTIFFRSETLSAWN